MNISTVINKKKKEAKKKKSTTSKQNSYLSLRNELFGPKNGEYYTSADKVIGSRLRVS